MNKQVNDSAQKQKHILKTRTGCHLSSHHLISYQLFYRLTTERINQMEAHSYSWNSGSNIVLLPHDGGSSISKDVACFYYLPFHTSAHQGKDIGNHWEKSGTNKAVNNPFASSSKQSKGKVTEMYMRDKKALDSRSFKGYHKSILSDFKTVLKKLKCNLTNVVYQGHLNTLSKEICLDVSEFNLLLSNTGYSFKENQSGCGSIECEGRLHSNVSTDWPDLSDVKNEIFIGSRLRLLKEL
ncbi:AHH domain-containing protein [Vibrio diabolicus]|uniref:AHH domain-containing protein n=1 Tax=Vibrio diabolicus TaxID=50719 RepID=UPI000CE9A1E1|nr:AHH domain-containing protein [Vibrio diabolicus]AVF61567.1 hypothetical protein AL537_19790 [Vibrio diabolicus]